MSRPSGGNAAPEAVRQEAGGEPAVPAEGTAPSTALLGEGRGESMSERHEGSGAPGAPRDGAGEALPQGGAAPIRPRAETAGTRPRAETAPTMPLEPKYLRPGASPSPPVLPSSPQARGSSRPGKKEQARNQPGSAGRSRSESRSSRPGAKEEAAARDRRDGGSGPTPRPSAAAKGGSAPRRGRASSHPPSFTASEEAFFARGAELAASVAPPESFDDLETGPPPKSFWRRLFRSGNSTPVRPDPPSKPRPRRR